MDILIYATGLHNILLWLHLYVVIVHIRVFYYCLSSNIGYFHGDILPLPSSSAHFSQIILKCNYLTILLCDPINSAWVSIRELSKTLQKHYNVVIPKFT